ncbi:MAG TPA: hypothetical protein VE615_05070 [Gaiellaceae bacterium]|jgi:hypothetical protein|nr:hypothetical protein [Gaiellaceae bacterium]
MEARPQFCPWCGSPIAYESHEHEPRIDLLAKQAGAAPPDRVRDVLAGESYVGVCQGCRTISHVVGHRPPG